MLLLSEEEYNKGNDLKEIIAPYICSCGHVQEGRTISYFLNKYQLCEICSKEKRKHDLAVKYGNDYETVRKNMLSDNKKLLTGKEYFVNNDTIEYECLLCGTINKIKYYTYKSKEHMCEGCRHLELLKEKWEKIIDIAKESGLEILTAFEEFIQDDSRLDIKCTCGNDFNTLTKEYLNNKRQCNVCGLKLRSGENAPRWKGGVTPENEKIRKSKEYSEWREKVFRRDGYICQCCGDDSGGNLRGHHIMNFSDHKDLRYSIDNGITMCDNCHNPNQVGSFHNIYGTHNNTKEQLQEFLDMRRKELGLPLVKIENIINKQLID